MNTQPLSIAQVADLCGVSRQSAYYWVRSCKLPATKFANGWLFDRQEVERFRAARSRASTRRGRPRTPAPSVPSTPPPPPTTDPGQLVRRIRDMGAVVPLVEVLSVWSELSDLVRDAGGPTAAVELAGLVLR